MYWFDRILLCAAVRSLPLPSLPAQRCHFKSGGDRRLTIPAGSLFVKTENRPLSLSTVPCLLDSLRRQENRPLVPQTVPLSPVPCPLSRVFQIGGHCYIFRPESQLTDSKRASTFSSGLGIIAQTPS